MRGRAGRKGKDEVGESFLCCQSSELDEVMQVLRANLPDVESSMTREKRGIKRSVRVRLRSETCTHRCRALLEVLTIRLATHRSAIDEYVRRTLLYHSMDTDQLKAWVDKTMDELQSAGQIRIDVAGTYEATALARATVGSCMTPEDGVFVHDELQRALRAFVMDGEMHIFYMFTPINIWSNGDINWRIFRSEIDRLDESGMRVLEFVGISPAFVNRMLVGLVELRVVLQLTHPQGQQWQAITRGRRGAATGRKGPPSILRRLPTSRSVPRGSNSHDCSKI